MKYPRLISVPPKIIPHVGILCEGSYDDKGRITLGLCPQIGRQYGIKNKAAIALQCKSKDKLIAALVFITCTCLIWGDSHIGKPGGME